MAASAVTPATTTTAMARGTGTHPQRRTLLIGEPPLTPGPCRCHQVEAPPRASWTLLHVPLPRLGLLLPSLIGERESPVKAGPAGSSRDRRSGAVRRGR